MSQPTTFSERASQCLEEEPLISALLQYARTHDCSMAIWNCPGDGLIQGVMDFDETTLETKISLDEMPSGFLFAPYNSESPRQLIRAKIHFTIGQEFTITPEDNAKSEEIKKFLANFPRETDHLPDSLTELFQGNSRNNYLQLIEQAIAAIKAGEFQKVVPSRSKSFQIKNLNIARQFLAFCTRYPQAFVSVTYTKDHGIWMGASPELLVKVTDHCEFETIALAGTQIYQENISIGDVAWTQKEIEEQALVCRYIINCFKKIRLREYEELGPKTIVAGNLIHLKTRFLVDMVKTGFPELGSVMLDLLHPTSAICGMPRQQAEAWLLQHENHDREFFSGYLGPVNLHEQTSLYVNLRCMKIDHDKVTFYAGAGVTEDSKPEKEWQETEMKMNTLLNVIREHSTNF